MTLVANDGAAYDVFPLDVVLGASIDSWPRAGA
jgi:hypothetical protein